MGKQMEEASSPRKRAWRLPSVHWTLGGGQGAARDAIGLTPAFAGMTVRSMRAAFASERQLHAGRERKAAGELLHFLGHVRLDMRLGVVEGGEDQILEHLALVRIDQ